MNIALGGSVLNAAYRLRRRKAPPGAAGLPGAIALAVNLGVPPLLFVQVLFGQFFYSSSVLMASYWLAVIPLLILAYYAAYLMQGKGGKAKGFRAGTIWSLVSALLLLAVAFAYVNNMSLMLRYGQWPGYFADKRGLMLALSDPALFPRFLHFAVGALAVASISWSAWARFRDRRARSRGEDLAEDGGAKETGLRLFWIFTAIQAPIGVAWLATLPKETVGLFMGGSAYGAVLLALGLLLAAGLLVHAIRGKFMATALILAPTLVVMVLMRDLVRASALSPVFSAEALKVEPQYGPLVLFLSTFAIGAAVLAWLIRAAFRAKPGAKLRTEGEETEGESG
jgi:hypothetical protein